MLIWSWLACAPAVGPPPSPPSQFTAAMVQRPIVFDDERHALTLAYLRTHVDPDLTSTALQPRAIVLHWTAVGNFLASHQIFAPVELQGRRDIEGGGRVNVSAHFLVDRDGTIARLMPETVVARHTIGLNHVAIGIENVGGDRDHPLTDAQIGANADLVRHLVARFPITHLLGHHEYRRMESHPYFRELDPDYRTTKVDPGDAFMAEVRRRVEDLGLAAPPVP